MGLYSNVILPRFYDCLMDQPFWAEHRKRQLAGAYGQVLEIGAGTGLNLPHYPETVETITTVDPNPGMNKMLERRIKCTGIEVDRRMATGEELPFDAGTFDCVVTTKTLCSIANARQALSELYRVLKPGGRYVFLEHGLSPDPNVLKWQRRLNWLQKRIAAGCQLDLDVPALVASQPFASVEIENFYMAKLAKTHGYMYMGTAVK